MIKRVSQLLAVAGLLAALWPAPAARADFGLNELDVTFTDLVGDPFTAAGAHPGVWETTLAFETSFNSEAGFDVPDGSPRDIRISAPPGLVANPTATARCTTVQFVTEACPASSQVGISAVSYGEPGNTEKAAVYNLAAPPGVAAKLGFFVASLLPVTIEGTVSPDPPYNIVASVKYVSQAQPFYGTKTTVWGNPADPSHDPDRRPVGPAGIPERAFLTLPRSCPGTALDFGFTFDSWHDPGATLPDGRPDLSDPRWLSATTSSPAVQGCENLDFDPAVDAAPTTSAADSPAGFDFSIDVDDPGLIDPKGSAESDLKKAIVTLPEGLAVNPSSADGLEACSQAQLADESASSDFGAGCPAASKVASVEVQTPLLDEPLGGAVFLATPFENPLGSLLAGYLVLKSPERGVVIKLPGKIDADPETGQLIASFDDNPQLPFSSLDVRFKLGNRAPLLTPSTCGTYAITTELYPWSGTAPVIDADTFAIDRGPDGGPCPAGVPAQPGDAAAQANLPNTPSFDAGTLSPIAKSFSPFVLDLRREDGSQRFSTVTVTPPPGLVAKLAGTEICSEAALQAAESKSGRSEQASPSCPVASRIGSVIAGAGAGPTPYHAPGIAYLGGPYKGAPLSLAIVTPGTAGPFDLGTIVVRSALYVDPPTTKITAVSDPLPRILQGIPLNVRSARVALDRPAFTLNPTSCNPRAVSGALASTLGQIAPLQSRFQLAECGRLGFKPDISLRLKGGTRRGAHPALTATLRPRAEDANIRGLSLKLPGWAFLEQGHIDTVCTRVQFAADRCPRGSIYGTVTASTPLLDYPLTGNVYLRSSNNLLPDLVPDLRGPAYQPLRIESAGRTDSVKGALRNTFTEIPDAPISSVVVRLFGGKRGLIVNSRNVCRADKHANVKFTAHNGATYTARPELLAQCKQKPKKSHGKSGRGSRRAERG